MKIRINLIFTDYFLFIGNSFLCNKKHSVKDIQEANAALRLSDYQRNKILTGMNTADYLYKLHILAEKYCINMEVYVQFLIRVTSTKNSNRYRAVMNAIF